MHIYLYDTDTDAILIRFLYDIYMISIETKGPSVFSPPQEVPNFDIVVSEVMDLWCLGEGIIPTMRHAHKKLLAPNGVLLPGKLRVYVQPLELSLWREVRQNVAKCGTWQKLKIFKMRIK